MKRCLSMALAITTLFSNQAMEQELSTEHLLKKALWCEHDCDAFQKALTRHDFKPCMNILSGGRPILADAITSYLVVSDPQKRLRLFLMIKELLERGADPNVYSDHFEPISKRCDYTTPYMIAYIMNHDDCLYRYDLIVLLLQYGLDKNQLRLEKERNSFDYHAQVQQLSQKQRVDDELKTWTLLYQDDVRAICPTQLYKTCIENINFEYEILKELIDNSESDIHQRKKLEKKIREQLKRAEKIRVAS